MDANRAMEALSALEHRQTMSASPDEQAALEGEGLVRSLSKSEADELGSLVDNLNALSSRIKTLGRALHGESSAIAYSGFPTDEAGMRRELQASVLQLEDASRHKAEADALVWNDGTDRYLELTLLGRQTLEDLQTWLPAMPGKSLAEFRATLSGTRAGMVAQAMRAAQILTKAAMNSETLNPSEFRPLAVMMARSSVAPERLAADWQALVFTTLRDGTPQKGAQVAASFLASYGEPRKDIAEAFLRVRHELAFRRYARDDEAILAAATVHMSDAERTACLDRVDALVHEVAGSPPVLLGPALSAWTIEELVQRIREAMGWFRVDGPMDQVRIASAAAILAGSAPPLDVLGRRIEVLRPGTASAFAPPEIAMAMLASGPFEAPQALEVLREAAIAISRANFYESPMEVDGLALILMHGFGPVPFVYQPPASVPPIASRWAAAVPIGLAFPWFLWQYFWIQQTYERYVKAHPGHYYGPYYWG